jgi:hypothetical protein
MRKLLLGSSAVGILAAFAFVQPASAGPSVEFCFGDFCVGKENDRGYDNCRYNWYWDEWECRYYDNRYDRHYWKRHRGTPKGHHKHKKHNKHKKGHGGGKHKKNK